MTPFAYNVRNVQMWPPRLGPGTAFALLCLVLLPFAGCESCDLDDKKKRWVKRPLPDLQPDVWRIAVVSDLNSKYGSTSYVKTVHRAVDRIVDIQPHLVISTGDMVAGQMPGLQYRRMWSAFHDAVSDPLDAAGIPFAVTPGNHDASRSKAYAEERAIFEEQWLDRRPNLDFVGDHFYPLRYSFQLGDDVLLIAIDDTSVGPLAKQQMAWLDKQLGRSSHPTKIVFGHVPLYPISEESRDQVIGDPDLEDLLVSHDVNLFISGHHHAWYPGKRGPLRLVSMACLGNGRRTLIGNSRKSDKSLAIIDISPEGIDHIEAYGGKFFEDMVLRESLPSSVGSGGFRIRRDDL